MVTDRGATTIPGTKIGTGAGAQVVGTGGRSWTGEGVIAGPVIRRGGPSEGSNTAPVARNLFLIIFVIIIHTIMFNLN